MNVNPGELNKRVQIIEMIDVQDDEGFHDLMEHVVREPWAKVSQYSAKEKLLSGTEMADRKMRFLIRYSNTYINEDMQVKYAGKYYEIIMINNYMESNEYLEIIGEKKEAV